MSKKIIAVFGGSFNPPINSHVCLAKSIIEKVNNIEKVIFVPVSTKYQKRDLAQDTDRLNMLEIICKKHDNLEVSDIELKSKEQLYTIQTLNYFKEQYKGNKIYFVMGTDNLKEFETWRTPEKILKDFKIIVIERDKDDLDKIIEESKLLSKNKKSIIRVEGIDRIDLSSTMIRNKIKNDEDIEEYVDKDVLKYIKDNNLYK